MSWLTPFSNQKPNINFRNIHFAFGACYDQFDWTLKRLKQKGVVIDGEPRDWGKSVSVYFCDPDDHQLEINFVRV